MRCEPRRNTSTPAKVIPMQSTEDFEVDASAMLACDDRSMQTGLDLISAIFHSIHTALPQGIAEQHFHKVRLGMGSIRRYFGSVWLDSLPVEWLLAISPEKVARKTSAAGSCLEFRERVHRIRVVQLHACAFGFHAPKAFEIILIEAYAAKLRRERDCCGQYAED